MFEWFFNLFHDEEEAEPQALPTPDPQPVQSQNDGVARFLIGFGGSGSFILALYALFMLGNKLFRAARDRADYQSPVIATVDMDAGSRGASMMTRMAELINAILKWDTGRVIGGPVRAVNASVSQDMENSTDENSIADMVRDDKAARDQISVVLTPGEMARPRKVGGYGIARVVQMWTGAMLHTDTLEALSDSIIQAYRNGHKVVVSLAGACIGATGATFLNAFSEAIYEGCRAVDPNRLGDLRIHNVVLLGYARHPVSDDIDDPIRLDSEEDGLRAANWIRNRQKEGIDQKVARTYFVDAPAVTACEQYSFGGEQYRHFTLGDLYALLAIRESLETPFESMYDGNRIFLPRTAEVGESRVTWSSFEDERFARSMVSSVRLAAFTWLKLRPMTVGVGDSELRKAPHIRKLLGEEATVAQLATVTRPLEALVALSREVLIAACEIASSGKDWSDPQSVFGNYDTVLFDPNLLQEILRGDMDGSEVNAFELDELTRWELPGGKEKYAFDTGSLTVNQAYDKAVDKVGPGDTAAKFLLELYRALCV
ncbi:MAG: hypothetical protein IJO51_00060 [Clostridia bacterium]|nr:hypothetical protein [Clostridia bacterium]